MRRLGRAAHASLDDEAVRVRLPSVPRQFPPSSDGPWRQCVHVAFCASVSCLGSAAARAASHDERGSGGAAQGARRG